MSFVEQHGVKLVSDPGETHVSSETAVAMLGGPSMAVARAARRVGVELAVRGAGGLFQG